MTITSVCEDAYIVQDTPISLTYYLGGADILFDPIPNLKVLDPSDGSLVTMCGDYLISYKDLYVSAPRVWNSNI